MISAKSIGKAVKDHRRSLKLTQSQLADAIGKTPDAISQIERGVNMPSVETVAALSRCLFVRVDDLLFPDKEGEHSSAREALLRNGALLLAKLSDRDLSVAIRQLQSFSDK